MPTPLSDFFGCASLISSAYLIEGVAEYNAQHHGQLRVGHRTALTHGRRWSIVMVQASDASLPKR